MMNNFFYACLVILYYGIHYFILLTYLSFNNLIKRKPIIFTIGSLVAGIAMYIFKSWDITKEHFGFIYLFILLMPLFILVSIYKMDILYILVATIVFFLEDSISLCLADVVFYICEEVIKFPVISNEALRYALFSTVDTCILLLILIYTKKFFNIQKYNHRVEIRLLWWNIIVVCVMGSLLIIASKALSSSAIPSDSIIITMVMMLIQIIMLSSIILNHSLNNILVKHKILLAEIHEKNLQIEKMNQQLEEVQEILIQKERFASLGQVAGGIAHNLKTPIMAISGNMETVKHLVNEYKESLDDSEVLIEDHYQIAKDMKEWLKKNNSLLDYMNKIIFYIINQTKDISHISEDRANVASIIEKVSIVMEGELTLNKCKLNIFNKISHNVYIKGKINILTQVICNLISNSIHSYNQKSGVIDLEFTTECKNILITVKDEGCGIPQKISQQLFKKMITTKGKDGTGLGLYISYSAIKGYFSGDITFESKEGSGTKFIITIPIF